MTTLAERVLGEAGERRLRCLKGADTPRAAPDPAFVVVSGVNARTGANGEVDVDLALSKRLYCLARGYAFEFYAADTFEGLLRAYTGNADARMGGRSDEARRRAAWRALMMLPRRASRSGFRRVHLCAASVEMRP